MTTAQLLLPDDPAPYELVNESASTPFLLTCDHAGRVLPQRLGNLGLPESELSRHIAWDLGAAGMSRALARRLDAFLILQTYSRLVIDVNRPPGTPESIVSLSERTTIPGNLQLTEEDRRAREQAVFTPYHARIEAELSRRARTNTPLILVSLHSFTPRFKDVDRRVHAGVLYGRDTRVAKLMLPALQRETDLVVGDNEPYAVSEETDYTVVVHAERRGLPYVELEVRQDMLSTEEGQNDWAERLARALEHSFSVLFPA
jgi:predicted N-formylglutamate amidohydrolase